MEEFNKIFKRLYKSLNFTMDKEICEKYNIKQNTLSGWRARGKIPYDLIREIAIKNDLSLDYLLLGKQEPINQNEIKDNMNTIAIMYQEREDIREIIKLLEYAPTSMISNMSKKLKEIQKISEI